jgi:hypothetical protein
MPTFEVDILFLPLIAQSHSEPCASFISLSLRLQTKEFNTGALDHLGWWEQSVWDLYLRGCQELEVWFKQYSTCFEFKSQNCQRERGCQLCLLLLSTKLLTDQYHITTSPQKPRIICKTKLRVRIVDYCGYTHPNTSSSKRNLSNSGK